MNKLIVKENKISHINIGQCIYCGKRNIPLTDEHVFPLSLGGNVILDRASCEDCRALTSKCERNITSNNWAEVRAITECKSRKRDWAKERFPLEVILKNGKRDILKLKKEESLGLCHFPLFPLPGFLNPRDYEKGSRWIGFDTISFGADLQKLSKKYKIKEISKTFNYTDHDFELMVTNIAYRVAIAQLGLDAMKEIFILPSIKREKDDVGYWLGCDLKEKYFKKIDRRKIGSHLAQVRFLEDEGKTQKVVAVRIKFFANSDSPEYFIIVGKLKK